MPCSSIFVRLEVSASGPLLLGVNDDRLGDNEGVFDVWLSVLPVLTQ